MRKHSVEHERQTDRPAEPLRYTQALALLGAMGASSGHQASCSPYHAWPLSRQPAASGMSTGRGVRSMSVIQSKPELHMRVKVGAASWQRAPHLSKLCCFAPLPAGRCIAFHKHFYERGSLRMSALKRAAPISSQSVACSWNMKKRMTRVTTESGHKSRREFLRS